MVPDWSIRLVYESVLHLTELPGPAQSPGEIYGLSGAFVAELLLVSAGFECHLSRRRSASQRDGKSALLQHD